MIAAPPFEAFEHALEAAIDRLDDASPNRALIREHFALDDPQAQRGKRLRPRMLVAVAQSEGAPAGHALPAAVAVELLHNFSLIHDDIEDRDEVRHGRPTLWARHGIAAAIGAGDAMAALAYVVLLDGFPRAQAARRAAMGRVLFRAHHEMTEGQAWDIGFERAPIVTYGEYRRMIEGKTAAVFGAACALGALSAGCGDERAAAYRDAGRAYGLAFQIRDDVLGSWGESGRTGKPSGADIRRRKWSFPVAWAIGGPPSPDRDLVAETYASSQDTLDDARADAVLAALVRLGAPRAADDACDAAIAHAKALAAQHGLDRAGALAALFDATAKRTA